jgi:hypothetical protein
MELCFCTVTGRTFSLEFDPASSVSDVKSGLASVLHVAASGLVLVAQATLLTDGQRISGLALGRGAPIVVHQAGAPVLRPGPAVDGAASGPASASASAAAAAAAEAAARDPPDMGARTAMLTPACAFRPACEAALRLSGFNPQAAQCLLRTPGFVEECRRGRAPAPAPAPAQGAAEAAGRGGSAQSRSQPQSQGAGWAEPAPGPAPERRPAPRAALAQILGQLSPTEAAAVRAMVRPGLDEGTVAQIFLACDRNAEQTQAVLRAWH